MQCNGSRLKECALLEGNALFKLNSVGFRYTYVLSKASKGMGTDKVIVLAQRVVTLLAILTFHTGNQRNTGYSVSRLQGSNPFAHRFYGSGILMSQNDGIVVCRVCVYTRNIGSADACIFYFDQYLTFFRHRFLDVLIANVTFSMNYASLHCFHY